MKAFLVNPILRKLKIPESAIRQINLAGNLSSVNGSGFPQELLLLSAPMIARGLLNYAVLQMKRDWVFPFWVHKQLDPASESYIPRSQNPLLMNLTHRNWTAVGTLRGGHEAIVDPRGLVTPLPREWSLDTWLTIGSKTLYPSWTSPISQQFRTTPPEVVTTFAAEDFELVLESFAATTRQGPDVLFHRATVSNRSSDPLPAILWFCIRPFNPEGIAPIDHLLVRGRYLEVNGATALVMAQPPELTLLGSSKDGDVMNMIGRARIQDAKRRIEVRCPEGLANAAAGYQLLVGAGQSESRTCSIALGDERSISAKPAKKTWRVSFEQRRNRQREEWMAESQSGALFEVADGGIQSIFDACKATLLQFHDGDFISPGPYLYHHFWFRDAALMLRGLDVLGYHKRTKEVLKVFPKRMTREGFFRGPDGEWDSNGAVLWTVLQHYRLTHSTLWLREWYPRLRKAASWIIQMRKKTIPGSIRGLMPASLSAEHLGTVDQYYWDTFWSVAGLRAIRQIAEELRKPEAEMYRAEEEAFMSAIVESLVAVDVQEQSRIPASPGRAFDESAIGSICPIYPLMLELNGDAARGTVHSLIDKYCDDKGFLHPFIHSGYNPYLTLQLAHSCLYMGEQERAWQIANTILRKLQPPYSLPEAIHPRTGGGCMGDGHHGWAAAEIILFVRDCLLDDSGDQLVLCAGAGGLLQKGRTMRIANAPTRFGSVSMRIEFQDQDHARVSFQNKFFSGGKPTTIVLHVPFHVRRSVPVIPEHLVSMSSKSPGTLLRFHPDVTTIFLDL